MSSSKELQRLSLHKIEDPLLVRAHNINRILAREFRRTAKTLSIEEALRIYGIKDEVEPPSRFSKRSKECWDNN